MASPQLQQAAVEWFRKAAQSAERDDWEAAANYYGQCVKMVPDNLAYRQHLRGSMKKKYNDNKKGAGFKGSLRINSIKTKIKVARAKKNWVDVDQLCEEGLKVNPWDGPLNSDLARAATERAFLDVAVFASTCAVESDPDNTNYLRQLGEILEQKNQFAQAAQMFERIMKLEPNNDEARRRVGELHTKATLHSGGYEDAESTREVQQNPEPTERVSAYEAFGKSSDVKTELTEEEQLQREVRKEPDRVEPRIKLAQCYGTAKEWLKAVKTYKEALEVSGGNTDIKEKMLEADVHRIRHDLDQARQRAAKNPDAPGPKKQVEQLGEGLRKSEIDFYEFREDRHPQDMRAKFELAKRYMQAGRLSDAITRFQQATNDSRLKGQALLSLGKCYGQDRKAGMALNAFERAIPELSPQDHTEDFCDAHYWAGRLQEQKGDNTAAEQHYTAVLSVNYSYKDANDRLVKLQGGDEMGMDFME